MSRPSDITKPQPVPPPSIEVLRSIWFNIGQPDECWPWRGAINPDGYPANIADGSGKRKSGYGHKSYPHRLMFQWFKWDIPDAMTIDHLCRDRSCMNPDHMEAVTAAENVRRGVKRWYCKRGHAQIPENRYIYGANGKRKERCRLCIPIQMAEWKAKRSEG